MPLPLQSRLMCGMEEFCLCLPVIIWDNKPGDLEAPGNLSYLTGEKQALLANQALIYTATWDLLPPPGPIQRSQSSTRIRGGAITVNKCQRTDELIYETETESGT